jgi:integrase
VLHVRLQLDRHGELVALKTEAAEREVPLPAPLVKALVEHQLASSYSTGECFVFCSEQGTPVHRRNLARRGLDKATEAAGVGHLRWHDLRHLAASWMIAAGASDDELCRTLGHANAAITKAFYAEEFERAARVDRMRERQAEAYVKMGR